MFKNEPDLLTRKQCQDLLHISKSKMLELIHKDCIPAIIIAGSYRIRGCKIKCVSSSKTFYL